MQGVVRIPICLDSYIRLHKTKQPVGPFRESHEFTDPLIYGKSGSTHHVTPTGSTATAATMGIRSALEGYQAHVHRRGRGAPARFAAGRAHARETRRRKAVGIDP